MAQTDIYDLTDNTRDVFRELHPDSDMKEYPTDEELTDIRAIIHAHYAWMAKRLGEGRRVQFGGCGTYTLKLRAGREVQNFQTGERYEIPDFLEVEFNAAPALETLIQEGLKPPVPNVK